MTVLTELRYSDAFSILLPEHQCPCSATKETFGATRLTGRLWPTLARDVIRIAAIQSSGRFHFPHSARPDPERPFAHK